VVRPAGGPNRGNAKANVEAAGASTEAAGAGVDAVDARVVAGRLAAQLLTRPDRRTPEDVVERLLALQAQEARGARLAVRSRSSGLLATDVDDALTHRRSLVVSWLNRGTLHLVTPEDYWWLHPLTTPQIATGNRRRLRQEGVSEADEAKGVAVIVESIATQGPQTRGQLRDTLDAHGVPTAGQALVHLLVAATRAGDIVRGPVVGSEQAFVSVSAWLGPRPPQLEHTEALARLARRYLAAHGPAGPPDLAKWAGIRRGDAQRGFELLGDELRPAAPGLWVLDGVTATRRLPSPRLLGPFDPVLLGWHSRLPFVGPHARVVTTNGIFRPAALIDGRVAALWRLSGSTVRLEPLEPISSSAVSALRRDATDLARFLGLAPVELTVP
jgi:hypothetical protein